MSEARGSGGGRRRAGAAKPASRAAAHAGLERELGLARQAALAAGAILRRHWNERSYKVGFKGRGNPVTSADLEADRAIRKILAAGFLDYGWLSEETADDKSRLSARRVWIVDPLDGTKEFINRVPEFCVAIALAEDGVPVLGVSYNPIKRELFWAARGMGCHLGARRVRVTRTRTLRRANVLASRSEVARGEWQVFDGQVEVSPTGSVAYKLARVAAGKGDATLTRSPKSEWDVASGAALIAEAGGRMTDIDGHELRFNQPSVRLHGLIASNGILHDDLRRLARRHGLMG
jgi:myo-inositol-1(or 4)-monophosphatase